MLHGYRMLDYWDAFVLVDELYVELMSNVGFIPVPHPVAHLGREFASFEEMLSEVTGTLVFRLRECPWL